jgi:hypothetical protein
LNGEVNAFQRSFVGEIRRLDEMERRLRLFQNQITSTSPPIGITPLSASVPFTSVGPRAAQAFDDLDVKLAEHEQRVGQINQSWETLGKRQRELEEAKCVLRETAGFFNQVSIFRGFISILAYRFSHRLTTDRSRFEVPSTMPTDPHLCSKTPQNTVRFLGRAASRA